jgi:putative spermidine/putrescine transport system permease protein
VTEGVARRPSTPVLALAAAVCLYLLLPVLVVVPMSFSSSRYLAFPPPGWSLEWYRRFLTDPVWRTAVATSFQLGLATAAFAGVIGTAAAYGIVRGRVSGKRWLTAFLLSPMIVPVIVSAISLYGFYVALGIAGRFVGVLAAHVVLATPMVTLSVAAVLQRFDPVYEQASLSLGAGPVRTFWAVTLPNILPGVLSGALFAFITSFDELVIVMFVGGRTMTLPRKIWDDLVVLIEPTQAAASTVLVAVSTTALVLWASLQRAAAGRRGGR